MNNKTIGSSFEQALCDTLSKYGFWCHLLNANRAGQPADIIAVKNGKAYLIDAKVCEKGTFPLSRMEENQRMAMELWRDLGNGEGWFALKLGEEVYMFSYRLLEECERFHKSLSDKHIVELGIPLAEWVK